MAVASTTIGFRSQDINHLLQCSICLEKIREPKELPCKHTFCKQCLEPLVNLRQQLRCAICRAYHKVPPEGIAGVPTDRKIQNLLDAHQVDLADRLEELCSIHTGQQLNMYCEVCREEICAHCLYDIRHKDHKDKAILATEKTSFMQKESIPEALEKLQCRLMSRQAEVQGRKDEIERAKEKLERKVIAENKAYDTVIAQLKGQLDTEKEKLTKRYDAVLQEHKRVLKQNLKEMKAAVNSGIDRLENQIRQAGVEMKLQQADKTLQRAKSGQTSSLRTLMTIHSNLLKADRELQGIPAIDKLTILQVEERRAKERDLDLEVVEIKWKESIESDKRRLEQDKVDAFLEMTDMISRLECLRLERDSLLLEMSSVRAELSECKKRITDRETEITALKEENESSRREIERIKKTSDQKLQRMKQWLKSCPDVADPVTSQPSNTLLVHNIPRGMDDTDLEVFFNSRKNGGRGDVDEVKFPLDSENPMSARITFDDCSTVERICSTTRKWEFGQIVQLEREHTKS